ncbi:hypothetical protein F4859DRAFT_525842 [Xylaria cf. heliscus]|nr:hypothetical protein F4859DRAFT_525842 [Xylaria cf. heliscus]
MPSAVYKTLNITELLILIFRQCDIRTLLTGAQRVSHLWHSTIDSTLAIQEALFFRPCIRDDGSEPVLNPLLVENFGLFFDGKAHTRESFHKLPIADGGKNGRRDAFMRQGASWRRMLVRQPPVRIAGVWEWESFGGHVVYPGKFRQLALSNFSCPSIDDFCECCEPIRKAGLCTRNLNLTMGMLYDDGVETGTSRISHFTYFWSPKTQTSFAFADGPRDQNVRIDEEIEGEEIEDEGRDNTKLLSELAKGVDLILAMRYPGTCIPGRPGLSRADIEFESRFKYPLYFLE